jgi:hypothetical protein
MIPLYKHPYAITWQTYHRLLDRSFSGIYKPFFDKDLAEMFSGSLPAKYEGYQFSVIENPHYLD